MNAPDARRGGLEVWAPSVVPPIGVELSDEQALAVAFRHLAGIGFAENMAGHITWQRDGRTDMFVNPWGLWWQEITASDICVVDGDARVVRGRWDVTPAIHIHTELHRVRDDARVVIHNHPYYVCVLAALGTLPELVHQTGSLFLDDLCLVDTYDGEIDTPARRRPRRPHRRREPDHSGQPRRHRHGSQPARGGLPRRLDRTSVQTGLRRHADRQGTGEHELVGHGRHAAFADRTGRRRVLGGGGADDHQGRSRRASVNGIAECALTAATRRHASPPPHTESRQFTLNDPHSTLLRCKGIRA